MEWHNYDLICFDFDGVLVDSEKLHYAAYRQMCAKRAISFKWDEQEYAKLVLYSADGLKKAITALYTKEPWEVLYQEKKTLLEQIIDEGVELMPGVEALLKELQGLPTCVVTNSPRCQIDKIRAMHPILNTIPRWITREDYTNPKPDPECYKLATQGKKRVLGFEDSPRGLQALLGSGAEGILVSSVLPQEDVDALSKEASFRHIHSFHTLLA